MESNDTKVISIDKYKSSVKNSPLLMGDAVETKDYTTSFGQSSSAQKTTPPPPQPENVETHEHASNIGGSTAQNIQEKAYPPPPQDNYQQNYMNDNTEEMEFNQEPERPEQEEKEQEAMMQMADSNAGMLIGLYSSFVPPIIADMLKSDVTKVRKVLDQNPQIDQKKVQEIEKFLNTSNKEIEQALKLTKEQVMMLKAALSKVLEQYNFQPTNPIVNLIMVVGTIAVMQFMAVKKIMKRRDEELIYFIEHFGVTVPEGMEGTFKKKVLKVKKTPDEMKEAA